jgi:hypothetical protein
VWGVITFLSPARRAVTLDQLPKTLAAERFSGPGDKKSGTDTVFEKRLACPVGIPSDFFLSILADRHHAFLGAFAENANITGGQIDILQFEGDELRDAQTGRIEQLQHGRITTTGGLLGIGGLEQAFDLVDRQNIRQLQTTFWQIDQSRRVTAKISSCARNR